jgi:thioredoxin 1
MSPPAPVLVVCLCAQWCNVCEDYRNRFAQVQQSVLADYPQSRFLWLDVEDEAELLEPLDIENFPTVLIGAGTEPVFFGVIGPQVAVLERMVRTMLQDSTARALPDPVVKALMSRILAMHA